MTDEEIINAVETSTKIALSDTIDELKEQYGENVKYDESDIEEMVDNISKGSRFTIAYLIKNGFITIENDRRKDNK